MARLPWLSAGASSSDLETGSLSLLHSIYGSQVSQVLLSSDDDMISGRQWTQDTRRRPRSSPAATRQERERIKLSFSQQQHAATSNLMQEQQQHARRPSTASVRPSTAHVRPSTASVRPSTAHVRPSTASVRPSTAHVRPSTAHVHSDRISSTTSIQRVIPRPKSALPNSSLILEDVDCETRTYNIHDTKPVSLTRVPEYVNFWQGKTLSQRDNSISMQSRKTWKRPKSDYGSRFLAHKKNNKSLGTVVEDGYDLTSSSSDILLERGSQTGVNHGKTDDDDDDKIMGSVGKRSDDNNQQLMNDEGKRQGSDGTEYRAKMRPSAANNMWAQRSQKSRRKDSTDGCGDSDENFFYKDQQLKSKWLEVGGNSSYNTRFELPMDIKLLEEMSPLEYLRAHCIISTHHMTLCSKVFTRLDTDKDGLLSSEELKVGLQKALHDSLSQPETNHLLELVHYKIDVNIDLHLFTALCCLASRIFTLHLMPGLAEKEMIECVDFEALEWKLRGCTISQSLHTLFTLL